jgi:membrane associated rhomboid family serine protease
VVRVFFTDAGLFGSCFGAIIPLLPEGLLGVITSPLLHGNIDHIIGNSIPIVALMFLLYQFYPLVANKVFVIGWLATGLLVWLLPPIDIFTGDYMYTCTIGASGVVYVLAFFLFFSGVFKWNTKLLTISMLVVLYYGSLIWGMLPEELFYNMQEPSKISWQAHLQEL